MNVCVCVNEMEIYEGRGGFRHYHCCTVQLLANSELHWPSVEMNFPPSQHFEVDERLPGYIYRNAFLLSNISVIM